MRFKVLGSGSKGNATLLHTNSLTLLIDAGLPVRALNALIREAQMPVDAILITHEHADHTKALKSFIKSTNIPVYLTEKTKDALHLEHSSIHYLTPYQPFYLKDLRIMPFSTRHDAADPVGFIFQMDALKLVYMVDTGYVPEVDASLFHNATGYIIESNYDVKRLFDSKRPYHLKKRIDSPTGHLSNHDASYHLSQWMGDQTKVVCFAHPSEDCNSDDLILNTFKDTLKSFNIQLNTIQTLIATQTALDWVDLKEKADA